MRARRTGRIGWGLLLVLCVGLGAAPLGAQQTTEPDGLQVKRGDVLFGNPRKTKSPCEVDLEKAIEATPEGRRIEDEGIERGSARYNILIAKANARVRRIVRRVAVKKGCDCVVKAGSIIKNPDNLTVGDLTDDVVAALDS